MNQMQTSSQDYINFICRLYGDAYDDREEDSRIGGENWEPGMRAAHKSIRLFQKELHEVYDIRLSRSKIQKILITGNRWSTERSRVIGALYEKLTASTKDGGKDLPLKAAVAAIAEHLGVSTVSVSINLPYQKVVYALNDKSRNAQRIQKCRMKKGK